MTDFDDSNENAKTPSEDNFRGIDDQNIAEISEALHENDKATVTETLEDLSPADTSYLLAKSRDEDREQLLTDHLPDIDPESFVHLDTELQRNVLSAIGAKNVVKLINALESDNALHLIEDLDDSYQQEIMRQLSANMRRTLEEGLSFPEDSAGRLMQREVVAVPQFWTVGKTIDYLREASSELPIDFFDIFVIDPTYHIKGQVPLNQLLRASRNTKLEEICIKDLKTIPAHIDQEEVAHIFRRDDLTSAPVTDKAGRLIGTITIDDIVDVIDEEAQEDILKMAGVDQSDLYRAAISSAGTRFRWLFVNLLTAILASIVISLFEATIQEIVAIAVLMPIVASMGGNAGTQTLTVAVRAIAMRELSDTDTWRVIWKEALIGSLNGLIFALITGLVAFFWFQNTMLGVVIGLAMIINMIVAGFFGAAIPIILNKRGSDPAVSSTVFLTTLTDIVGFFVFLALASTLLL